MSLGYVKGCGGAPSAASKVKDALNAHDMKNLKVQETCSREIRQLGVNTMHSATLVYMQSWDLQRKVRQLMVVGRPLERWFHDRHLNNGDEAATLDFNVGNVGDEGLSPLR